MTIDHAHVLAHGLPPVTPGGWHPRLARTLLGTDTPTILDIGANDGQTSQAFLEAYPRGRVVCFEPDPRAFAKLTARLGGGPAELHQVAIGDRDQMTAFHQSGGSLPGHEVEYPLGWDQSGSLRPPKTHLQVWPWVTFDERITVRSRTLDSVAEQLGIDSVDLIWMDVQGAEDLVIAGGPRTLARTRWLYTEYSEEEWYVGQRGLVDLLAMLPGWCIEARYPMDVLLRNTAMSSGRSRPAQADPLSLR